MTQLDLLAWRPPILPYRTPAEWKARRIAALEDLLHHPRHSISAKDRAWLEKELRQERRK